MMTQLLKDYPNAAPVHAQMGGLLMIKKDRAGARREFERAMALQPGAVDALNGLVALAIQERDGGRARIGSLRRNASRSAASAAALG